MTMRRRGQKGRNERRTTDGRDRGRHCGADGGRMRVRPARFDRAIAAVARERNVAHVSVRRDAQRSLRRARFARRLADRTRRSHQRRFRPRRNDAVRRQFRPQTLRDRRAHGKDPLESADRRHPHVDAGLCQGHSDRRQRTQRFHETRRSGFTNVGTPRGQQRLRLFARRQAAVEIPYGRRGYADARNRRRHRRFRKRRRARIRARSHDGQAQVAGAAGRSGHDGVDGDRQRRRLHQLVSQRALLLRNARARRA